MEPFSEFNFPVLCTLITGTASHAGARICHQSLSSQCGSNHVSSLIDFWYCINQRIQELEATLYNALQQETVIKFGELLTEKQQEELRTAVEKLRRQMLRKSREYDCQILQERMELLQQAHQVRRHHTHVVSIQPFCVRTQTELKSRQAPGHEGAWHLAF